MAFVVIHRDGRRSKDPPLPAVAALLDELREGPGTVVVRHATGWALRVHADGMLEFGNDLDPTTGDLHRPPLPDPILAELMQGIAVGSLYETLEHEWRRGHRPI